MPGGEQNDAERVERIKAMYIELETWFTNIQWAMAEKQAEVEGQRKERPVAETLKLLKQLRTLKPDEILYNTNADALIATDAQKGRWQFSFLPTEDEAKRLQIYYKPETSPAKPEFVMNLIEHPDDLEIRSLISNYSAGLTIIHLKQKPPA